VHLDKKLKISFLLCLGMAVKINESLVRYVDL